MNKCIKLTFLPIFLCVILSGCPNPKAYRNHPTAQIGTYWISDDESVCLYVPESDSDHCIGVIKKQNVYFQVTFEFFIYSGAISVYDNNGNYLNFEEVQAKIESELWTGSDISKDKFHISILKSAYFEDDSEIILYKTDEKDVSEEIKKNLDNHPQR